MSLTTPTTQSIGDNIIAQLQASLSQTIPMLPQSFSRVLAKVLSGVFILLYKYGGFMFLQMFVAYASDKPTEINGKIVIPLVEWGRLYGVGDPTAATQAELLIDITVENPVGSLPAGTQLIGADNGVTYITLAAVALVGSTVQATVRAVADQSGGDGSGTVGNLNAGAVLSFANPLADVARDATVDSQTVTGAEAEDTEVYRQRIIDRAQKRPQGGALADYELWAEEAAGILNAYPYTSDCPGQVDVYLEATEASSGSPDGIPTAAQLIAALALIEYDSGGMATRRPANALVNTYAITRQGFTVEVAGLVVDSLAEVQNTIESALTEYFLAREPFIVGLSILPRQDRITESAVAGTVEQIVAAAGGIFESATIFYGSVPTGFYTLGIGEKAKLSSVTFI